MPTLAAGNKGLTLIELLVVVAIMALATAGASLALRDSSQTRLEREAQRLALLLETARVQSRMNAAPVRWLPTEHGFSFEGQTGTPLPTRWLGADVQVHPARAVVLGPEPVIGPQQIHLQLRTEPQRQLVVATDGVHPFVVRADAPSSP